MDAETLIGNLVDWIEIDSVTGNELDYGDALGRALATAGFDVEHQEVEPGRRNLLARAGRPEVVFCTHLDTVPPYFGSRVDRDFVHGRGSCDAKGQAAAMLEAGKALLASGEDRIGFLFTVGEETTSDGADVANARLAEPWAPRHTIVGEPTGNAFVRAHKGLFHAHLHGHGRTGHSSMPGGPSAVHELCAAVTRVLAADWGRHPDLGPGTVNIGTIHGGLAPNVYADRAEATFLLRAVEDPRRAEERLRSLLGEHVTLEITGNCYGPTEFLVPPDAGPEEDGGVVAFGTDAPHLSRWGRPLLFGCGDILDAHTEHEKVARRDLLACASRLERTVRGLLERVPTA